MAFTHKQDIPISALLINFVTKLSWMNTESWVSVSPTIHNFILHSLVAYGRAVAPNPSRSALSFLNNQHVWQDQALCFPKVNWSYYCCTISSLGIILSRKCLENLTHGAVLLRIWLGHVIFTCSSVYSLTRDGIELLASILNIVHDWNLLNFFQDMSLKTQNLGYWPARDRGFGPWPELSSLFFPHQLLVAMHRWGCLKLPNNEESSRVIKWCPLQDRAIGHDSEFKLKQAGCLNNSYNDQHTGLSLGRKLGGYYLTDSVQQSPYDHRIYAAGTKMDILFVIFPG